MLGSELSFKFTVKVNDFEKFPFLTILSNKLTGFSIHCTDGKEEQSRGTVD